LKAGRAQYAHDPYGLIAASHVLASDPIGPVTARCPRTQ
jgi:hypothetical protein